MGEFASIRTRAGTRRREVDARGTARAGERARGSARDARAGWREGIDVRWSSRGSARKGRRRRGGGARVGDAVAGPRGRGPTRRAEEEDAYAEEEEADALLREIFEEAGVEATWMALGEDEDVEISGVANDINALLSGDVFAARTPARRARRRRERRWRRERWRWCRANRSMGWRTCPW